MLTGGGLRLAPRRHCRCGRSDADPLRAVFGASSTPAGSTATGGLGHPEAAYVQVIARPVTGRRAARARRSTHHLHGTSRSPVILDALVAIFVPALLSQRDSDANT